MPSLLVIDGDCTFWALQRDEERGRNSEARTGVLTPSELGAINAELLTGPWASVDGLHFHREPIVSDAGSTELRRDEVAAGCEGWCRDAGALGQLESAARRWLDALYARGQPVAGPVLVVGARSAGAEGGLEWAGVTPLAPSFPDDETRSRGSVVVDDPDDARLLRAIRASTGADEVTSIRDDGIRIDVTIHDMLPESALPPSER